MSKRKRQFRSVGNSNLAPGMSRKKSSPSGILTGIGLLDWKCAGGIVLIIVATSLVYWPALHGEFIFDDASLISQNDVIQSPNGLYQIWFTTNSQDYWPVTNTSFWLQWRLSGSNVTSYHVINLTLHIAASWLIWIILAKLLVPGSFLAALLFAMHPVNVESVAWIAQRKNVLALVFFLLSILWYLKAQNIGSNYAETDEPSQRRINFPSHLGRWYALSLLAFTLAMLSKGSVAILPLILLLIIWWQRNRIAFLDIWQTAPFFVVAMLLTAVNIWFQTHGSEIAFRHATFLERLLGAAAAVWFYLSKALWPLQLSFSYPQWNIEAVNFLWWLPLLAALVVTAVLFWQRPCPWRRALLVAWIFFCISLMPVMGFIDVGYMAYSLVADHYQNIAIISVVAIVAAGWTTWSRHMNFVQPLNRILAGSFVGVLAVLTWQQCKLYADPITLYRATLQTNPDSWLIETSLGVALNQAGHPQEAIEHYRHAIQMNPDYDYAHNDLGVALTVLGQDSEAIEEYKQAIRLNQDNAEAHDNLGKALAHDGQPQEAIEEFRTALSLKHDAQVKSNLMLACNTWAESLLAQGRATEAIDLLQHALQVNPDDAVAHSNLGRAFFNVGQLNEAEQHLEEAIRLQPNRATTQYNLATFYGKSGDWGNAIKYLEAAIRIDPDFAKAHDNLGVALANSGRLPEALEHFKLAARLLPDDASVHYNYGNALSKSDRPAEAIEQFENVVRLKPDYVQAWFKLATLYADTNHPANALTAAEKSLQRARFLKQVEQSQEIETWLNKYRAQHPALKNSSPQSVPGNTTP